MSPRFAETADSTRGGGGGLPFSNFESAARGVISLLHGRLGFGLWMITRIEGDNWIVLHSEDQSYDVVPGKVFRWADSFCSRMVQGQGPRVAPDVASVPAYAAAPIASQVPIGSYMGAPIYSEDGSLFGTLCAIDPNRQPEVIASEQVLVDMFASLLSTILQAELKLDEALRKTERLQVEASTDPLTGLYNRRAWDKLLAQEEERCRRYGNSAFVIACDLNGLKQVNDTFGHAAGDELIIRAAGALRRAARDADVVARIGGDEFVVLAVECDHAGAGALVARLRDALTQAQVTASIGMAGRTQTGSLEVAKNVADQLMYEEKRSSGASRSARGAQPQ